MKKIYLPIIITAFVAGAIAFYGGMKYAQGSNVSNGFRNMTPEQRQQLLQNGGGNVFLGGRNSSQLGTGSNGVNGEITSQDDKSITVKTRGGGSKIIFFSDSTHIMKTTDGAKTDLASGKTVLVTGTTNPDGSITAQNIQIRPSDKSTG